MSPTMGLYTSTRRESRGRDRRDKMLQRGYVVNVFAAEEGRENQSFVKLNSA